MTKKDTSGANPRLRFPEFWDLKSWEKTPLSSVMTEHKLKSDDTSEVHSVSFAKGVVSQIEHLGRSYAAEDTSNYSLVRPFDVIYTRSPLSLFRLGIVKQHRRAHNALVSPLYGVFSPKNRYVGQLIEAYFDSPSRNLRFLDPLAQKGAKNTIQLSNENFLAGEIYLPKDEREQQKIADCLTSLDEVITAQERKVERLKAHKRGLMQQLFPPEGETVPRQRFPEYRDAPEWNVLALGELLATKPTYGVNEPAVAYTTKLPAYLRITDIDEDGRLLPGGRVSVNIEAKEDDVLIDGDIVLARTGASVGKSYRYRQEDGRLVYAGFLIRIRPNKTKVVPAFVSSFLTTDRYWSWVRATSARSGQPGLNGSEFSVLPVPIPPPTKNGDALAEQRRIAECFSSLDDQIAGESSKQQLWKAHKTGLMQQLFPTQNEA